MSVLGPKRLCHTQARDSCAILSLGEPQSKVRHHYCALGHTSIFDSRTLGNVTNKLEVG